jgi:hypothetical protein
MNFPYVAASAGAFGYVNMPILPIRLTAGSIVSDEHALLDSGATVSVLPFDVGLRLGLNWNTPMPLVPLSGNLQQQVAKGVKLQMQVGGFPFVEIVFAWSQSSNAPLLLGEFNFFAEFDVCFRRSRDYFEVKPRP